jgi:TusA-related sulfurtransferase
MSDKYADKTIDLRGLKGLEVETRIRTSLDRLAVGEGLNVLFDSESEQAIIRLVQRTGNELLSGVGVVGNGSQFLIRKS